MFPTEQRLIYQIDTSGLASEYNVYVDINIPESVYSTLTNAITAGEQWVCVMEQNYVWSDVYPRAYYFSDADNTQRYFQYTVLDTYEYTADCGEPLPTTFRLPKAIRVFIPTLDTYNSEYNAFGHYIALYVLGDQHLFSFDYDVKGWAANVSHYRSTPPHVASNDISQWTPPNTMAFTAYTGTATLSASVITFPGTPLSIPIPDNASHLFYGNYYAISGNARIVGFLLLGSDGKRYLIGDLAPSTPYPIDVTYTYTWNIPSGSIVDLAPVITQITGKPLSFFVAFDGPIFYARTWGTYNYPGTFWVDDIFVVVR